MKTWCSAFACIVPRGELRHDELDDAVEKALIEVGLWKDLKDRLDDRATTLQLEQQQKLCIARLLRLKPEVILMDEPCSALDVEATRAIEELMFDLRGRYTLVVRHAQHGTGEAGERRMHLHAARRGGGAQSHRGPVPGAAKPENRGVHRRADG